ncbi:MAG: DUF5663 domain-containing protein [Nitrospirota bacterium]|nr:DUF5663 domain-containing protein [Nitrospirota bacterium]
MNSLTPKNTSLLDALEISDLPAEEQEAVLLEINELVFKGSMLRMIEQMDEATSEAFTALMDSDADEEAVEAFIAQNVPGADQAVLDTIKELTDDILVATGTNTN